MKTNSIRKTILLTLIIALITVSTTGCTRKGWLVKKSEKEKVIQVVNSNADGGDAEAIIQEVLKNSSEFSNIYGGKWKWNITAEGDGIYVADYGYWGHYVWWKIVLGGIIWFITFAITGVITGGQAAVGYNPWPATCGPISVYVPLRVDTINNTIELLDRDPYLEETCVEVDVE